MFQKLTLSHKQTLRPLSLNPERFLHEYVFSNHTTDIKTRTFKKRYCRGDHLNKTLVNEFNFDSLETVNALVNKLYFNSVSRTVLPVMCRKIIELGISI